MSCLGLVEILLQRTTVMQRQGASIPYLRICSYYQGKSTSRVALAERWFVYDAHGNVCRCASRTVLPVDTISPFNDKTD